MARVLRGFRTEENDRFTVFSAMIHDVGVTVAQGEVPAGTNRDDLGGCVAETYIGSGRHVLATLRNTAAGLLRLNDFTMIKKATEWICRNRNRALSLLAT